jgi:hypothetical protein
MSDPPVTDGLFEHDGKTAKTASVASVASPTRRPITTMYSRFSHLFHKVIYCDLDSIMGIMAQPRGATGAISSCRPVNAHINASAMASNMLVSKKRYHTVSTPNTSRKSVPSCQQYDTSDEAHTPVLWHMHQDQIVYGAPVVPAAPPMTVPLQQQVTTKNKRHARSLNGDDDLAQQAVEWYDRLLGDLNRTPDPASMWIEYRDPDSGMMMHSHVNAKDMACQDLQHRTVYGKPMDPTHWISIVDVPATQMTVYINACHRDSLFGLFVVCHRRNKTVTACSVQMAYHYYRFAF